MLVCANAYAIIYPCNGRFLPSRMPKFMCKGNSLASTGGYVFLQKGMWIGLVCRKGMWVCLIDKKGATRLFLQ
jgi:hypothetical protein